MYVGFKLKRVEELTQREGDFISTGVGASIAGPCIHATKGKKPLHNRLYGSPQPQAQTPCSSRRSLFGAISKCHLNRINDNELFVV